MGTAYFDPRSVALRLNRTICIYEGRPVFVEVPENQRNVQDWHKVSIVNLPYTPDNAANSRTVDYREDAFDYRAFPLGYINLVSGTAHYLMRIPSRQQKQGLCKSCISGLPHIQGSGWFTSEEMKNCILGVYPSFKQAIEDVTTYRRQSTAISREVAIAMPGTLTTLMYRGRQIGYKDGDGFRLYPGKDQAILRDALRETTGEICII